MSGKLLIVRGLPGSGKSTLAKNMLASGAFDAHFEADMFFCRGQGGKYRFDPSKLGEAHGWCQSETRAALARGERVVVSNTFTMRWEAAPYLAMCEELGAESAIIVADGDFGSIHGVPEEAIQRMRDRWEDF